MYSYAPCLFLHEYHGKGCLVCALKSLYYNWTPFLKMWLQLHWWFNSQYRDKTLQEWPWSLTNAVNNAFVLTPNADGCLFWTWYLSARHSYSTHSYSVPVRETFWPKAALGRKGFTLITKSGVRGRNSSGKLKQKPQRNSACWLTHRRVLVSLPI